MDFLITLMSAYLLVWSANMISSAREYESTKVRAAWHVAAVLLCVLGLYTFRSTL